MPSLKINTSNGPINFVYRDSGPPNSEIYTTLVIAHGLVYHSGAFQRILPISARTGTRMICLNRRDYAGSTLFSPSELKVMSEGDEVERSAFLRARGVEMALFLDRLIDELNLPEPTAGENEGGLAVMGWSLGNVFTIALLAAASSIPLNIRNRLQRYLRRSVLFEPPSVAIGISGPPKQYAPFFDESIPPTERNQAFVRWVASYFAHGDLSKRDLDSLAYKTPDPSRKGATSLMSPEELDSMLDYTPASGSELFLRARFESEIYEQTIKALFDPETRSLWPRLETWLLYCDSSAWTMIHAAWEVESLVGTRDKKAVKFLVIEDAHHMVFWNEPKRAMNAFNYCLQN